MYRGLYYASSVNKGCGRWFCCCAVFLWLQAAALAQTNAAAALAKAHDALEHDRFAEVVALLRPLAAAEPPVPGAWRELGFAYYRNGQLNDAQQAFSAAARLDASDNESVQMEGLTLYRMGRFAEAVPFLERVRQWMPHANADANYVLGLCYLNAQQVDKARQAFALQYAVPADSAQAYLLLAQLLLHAQLDDPAAVQARKALAIQTDLPLAHFVLGEVELAKTRVEQALVEFELERKVNPGYAPLYDRLGDAYARLDRLDEAQQALTRAIALERTSTGPFILMGKVLLRKSDPGTALLYLQRAAQMDPNNAMTHILLSQAYARTGRAQDAKRESDVGSRLRSAEIQAKP
jgi:Flp pilus assembly protein TadD